MWRSIDIRDHGEHWNDVHNLFKLCRQAVDRTSGGLLDVNLEYFVVDDLLRYITDRSMHLRRLRVVHCVDVSNMGLVEVVGKIPVLQELDILYCQFSSEVVAVVGGLYPLLDSFKLNAHGCTRSYLECDDEAFAIAKNIPGLHYLQIFGNKLMNAGLVTILDGCQHLESLDLRQFFNVNLDADFKLSILEDPLQVGHMGYLCTNLRGSVEYIQYSTLYNLSTFNVVQY